MIEPLTRLTASLCAPVDHTKMIALDSITPNRYQSRKEFDREALDQLAQSIHKHGLLQNITVRAAGPGRYELIAGERRVRACRLLGQSHIRATIIHADEREAAVLCLLENLQRRDLNFFEEAQGYERLVRDLGMTQQQLAQSLGLAQSTVANRLRLLRLHACVRTEILRLGLTERHARELLRLHDMHMQLQAIDQIACRLLNVRQTEDLVAQMLQGALSNERAKTKPTFSRAWRDWRLFANTMKTAVLELKAAGLNAAFDLHDTGDAVEMRVVVPKARGNASAGAPPSAPTA